MLDVAFVLLLTTWSALVGRAILARLDAVPDNRWDAAAMAVPLGLGVLALAALGLGEIGWLDRGGLGIVFAAGIAVSLRQMHATSPVGAESCSPGREPRVSDATMDSEPRRGDIAAGGCRLYGAGDVREESATRGSRPGLYDSAPLGLNWQTPWLDRIFGLSLAVALAGTILTALGPVTDGDALCYHLQVPKMFLIERAVTFDPDLHETVYPLVTEMLYAVALAFRGPIACRLVQWVLGLCFAANVAALARPALGQRAWWAGTIALLVPAVSNGMSAPLNDVSLAAYANAALAAVMLFQDRPTARRAILAGVLAGLAIGVKYPALVWAGVLGCVVLAIRPRLAIVFALLAIAIGGPWYLRAYMHTSNPVYPFFRHAFGGSGLDDVLDPIKRPMTVTAWNVVTALGPMTLEPDRFDSVSHQFGPVFLLFLPGMFLLRPPRRIVVIASIGFAFMAICLTQRQSMRFLLAAVGPFSVGAAWVAVAWSRRPGLASRGLGVLLALILMFEAAIAAGHARHGIAVAFGRESEASYLSRREPTYRVGRWIDANLPREARIIGQEHRGYYLPRPYAMELAHRRRTRLGTHDETADELVATLRGAGFTHLLTCPPEPEDAVEFDGALTRRLAPWLASRRPLYEEAIRDPDGVVRRYRIDAMEHGGSSR